MPVVSLVFLIVVLFAVAFGLKVLEKSGPVEIKFSARYQELREKEFLTAEEREEFETERCRFNRGLVLYIQENDPSGFDQAKANYTARCQSKLPL
jgi:hypothetical protein